MDPSSPPRQPTLDRRRLLRDGLAIAGGIFAGPMINLGSFDLFGSQGPRVGARALEVVQESTVIDMLGLLTLDWSRLLQWQRDPASFGVADFERLRASGVNVFHPAVETSSPRPVQAAVLWLRRWDHLLRSRPDCFRFIGTAGDLGGARKDGKVGIVLGFQDSDHFRTEADVASFFRLGQRVSQLTYNDRNRIGSGCLVPEDDGLTPFGAEVVQAMNEVGMAIDVSHCGDRTSLDTCALSTFPVLVTHANCRALAPGVARCKPDRVIRAMARTGGVMGITNVRAFVGSRRADLSELLDHFDHVARLVGVEHVGLGSDTDVDARVPTTRQLRPAYRIRGLDLPRRVFQIADGLLRRGYRPSDVGLVLGGNFARALRAIWSAADCRQEERDEAPVLDCRAEERDPFLPPPGFSRE